MSGSKIPPEDFFRDIGFDTVMGLLPGGMRETIFFVGPRTVDNPHGDRREKASPEAIAEFIHYWSHQIQIAAEYLENGCNPNTHEWRT